MEYIKVKWNGEILFTIDHELAKNNFLAVIFGAKISQGRKVSLTKGNVTRAATTYTFNEQFIFKMLDGMYYIFIPKGAELIIYGN